MNKNSQWGGYQKINKDNQPRYLATCQNNYLNKGII